MAQNFINTNYQLFLQHRNLQEKKSIGLSDPALTIIKPHNQNLIDKATTLVRSGVLKQDDNYYFLKIDDDFIHELYPKLEQNKLIAKPDYFSLVNPIGAHITIAYEEENVILDKNEM